MKKLFFSFMILFLSLSLFAKEVDLATEEANFDLKSSKEGFKNAIKSFANNDCLMVGTKILPLKESLKNIEETKDVIFYPDRLYISSSEDLGFVFGIFEEKFSGKTLFYGYYLNVWQKIKGKWRIIVHQKTFFSPRLGEDLPQEMQKISITKGKEPQKSLEDIEKEILTNLKQTGSAKVYKDYGDKNIIKLRELSKAERGKQVFVRAVAEKGGIDGELKYTFSSDSKDLAIFIGYAKTTGAQPKASGTFIHILKLDEEGNYKIILDATSLTRQFVKREIM